LVFSCPEGSGDGTQEIRDAFLTRSAFAYDAKAGARHQAKVDLSQRELTAAETSVVSSDTSLSEAVARYLYKLMAYKDEYEVARLYTDPEFIAKLQAQFKRGYTAKYHLAPPPLSKKDPVTRHLIKRDFGPWIFTAFKFLAKLKGLRGGAFDIFGRTAERRHERQMIEDCIEEVEEIASKLSSKNHEAAVVLASVPDEIRGYAHVKEKSIDAAKVLHDRRLAAFSNPQKTIPVKVAA